MLIRTLVQPISCHSNFPEGLPSTVIAAEHTRPFPFVQQLGAPTLGVQQPLVQSHRLTPLDTWRDMSYGMA